MGEAGRKGAPGPLRGSGPAELNISKPTNFYRFLLSLSLLFLLSDHCLHGRSRRAFPKVCVCGGGGGSLEGGLSAPFNRGPGLYLASCFIYSASPMKR